jgi:hypothetical protein
MNSDALEICLDKVTGNQFFDQIIVGRFTRISFHRTLRIPEDGRDYPLPAALGRFPIHRVEDYADKVPTKWLKDGGFFIPIYQKEALFLQFEGPIWHPTIAKVCVGKINAITGKQYSAALSKTHQDYVVIPHQKWLDGVCSGEGLVRQFVAMPLGQGYTIEAQITDEERFGGFQVVVFECASGRFHERNPSKDYWIKAAESNKRSTRLYSASGPLWFDRDPDVSMGIAAGGNIKQQIQKDSYGVESWNPNKMRNLTIHLVNSKSYKAITGFDPPESPITAEAYESARIPWFSDYDETVPAIKPTSIFKRIMSISVIEKRRGISGTKDREQRLAAIQNIHRIRTPDKNEAVQAFRNRAYESYSKNWWDSAVREISYVIDLDVDVRANDFVLRSCCNYHLGHFREGSIDASLGLERDQKCVEALTWRAYCRKKLGEHEDLDEDADALLQIRETELIGLEMKAEAALLAGRYDDVLKSAMRLKTRHPGHIRADEICHEAKKKLL